VVTESIGVMQERRIKCRAFMAAEYSSAAPDFEGKSDIAPFKVCCKMVERMMVERMVDREHHLNS
jgi:hypothetical protein